MDQYGTHVRPDIVNYLKKDFKTECDWVPKGLTSALQSWCLFQCLIQGTYAWPMASVVRRWIPNWIHTRWTTKTSILHSHHEELYGHMISVSIRDFLDIIAVWTKLYMCATILHLISSIILSNLNYFIWCNSCVYMVYFSTRVLHSKISIWYMHVFYMGRIRVSYTKQYSAITRFWHVRAIIDWACTRRLRSGYPVFYYLEVYVPHC